MIINTNKDVKLIVVEIEWWYYIKKDEMVSEEDESFYLVIYCST